MDESETDVAAASDAENPPKLLPQENGTPQKSDHDGNPAEERSKSIARAIKRLNKHLADPKMVARDRAARGGIFQSSTKIFTALAVTMGAASYVASTNRDSDSSYDKPLVIFIVLSVFVGAAALAAIIFDLISMTAKGFKTPIEAMDGFLTATRSRRFGLTWSMLSPSARKDQVVAPNLGILPVEKKTITLQTPADFERYIRSFWRSPGGNYLFRSHLHLVEEQGDVAIVKVVAIFRRENLWLIVGAAALLGYFMLELGGLGALLAMYFGGKGHRIAYLKTLIRGSNGYWYMYSGDFFESINTEAQIVSSSK